MDAMSSRERKTQRRRIPNYKRKTMDASSGRFDRASGYELVFLPLHQGCSYAFPCDAAGVVELDRLTQHARHNYLLLSALVGRDFQMPSIVRCAN